MKHKIETTSGFWQSAESIRLEHRHKIKENTPLEPEGVPVSDADAIEASYEDLTSPHWRAIVDSLDDELIVVDRHMRIKWVNAAARRRLVRAKKRGQPLEISSISGTLPGTSKWNQARQPCLADAHKRHRCPLVARNCPAVNVFDTGEPVRTTCSHLKGDGSTRVVEIIASPVYDEHGEIHEVVKLSRDITEQHNLQETLFMRHRELSALAVISVALGRSLDLKEILETALDQVLQLTGYDVGTIFVLRQRTEEFELMACKGLSQEAAWPMSRLHLSTRPCGGVAEAGIPVVIPNLSLYRGNIWQNLKQENLCSMVHVPLIAKQITRGSLCVGTREPHNFTEEEVSLLSAICNQIAVAVENACLYREMERREQLRGKLLEQVITAQEDERKRVARELHDDISQFLTGLLYTVEKATETTDSDELQKLLARMQNISLEALEAVFNIIYDLRPSLLDHLGLCVALRSYAEKRFAPDVHVHLGQTGDVRRLPGSVETAIFRVVQEAISNIAKHAGARKVEISLDFQEQFTTVTVEDNGIGFDLEEAVPSPNGGRRGLGLLGMKERIELLGGDIHITSEPNAGTCLFIRVPTAGVEANTEVSRPSTS